MRICCAIIYRHKMRFLLIWNVVQPRKQNLQKHFSVSRCNNVSVAQIIKFVENSILICIYCERGLYTMEFCYQLMIIYRLIRSVLVVDSNDPKQLFIGVDSSKFYRLCANSFERIWERFHIFMCDFCPATSDSFHLTLNQQIHATGIRRWALLLFIQ